MSTKTLCFVLSVALLSAAPTVAAGLAPAGTPQPFFSHKDWGLQCDNTRTCRAEGYQAQMGGSDPVSMLITRAAGPDTPVEIALQVDSEQTFSEPLQFKLGRLLLAGLTGEIIKLTPVQVQMVLPELLKNESAIVLAAAPGKNPGQALQWTLSLAGVNAVLLKMDEAQGRLDTPGALVRKGSRAEARVLPPLPLPQLRGQLPVPTRSSDAALAQPIFAAIGAAQTSQLRDQCNRLDELPLQVHRLSASQVLLSAACATGAYNSTEILWLANDKPPYTPQLLEANGEFDSAGASVHSAQKNRGAGDCWRFKSWQWDGNSFTLSDVSGNFMCRGFLGGAWQLPIYKTRIVFPASHKAAASGNPPKKQH